MAVRREPATKSPSDDDLAPLATTSETAAAWRRWASRPEPANEPRPTPVVRTRPVGI
jgi:hypothetical protein